MISVPAAYFDGHSSRRWVASLDLEAGEAILRGEFGERRFPLDKLTLAENMGGELRCLELPEGARCEIADLAAFAEWQAAAGLQEGVVARIQQSWHWALAALGLVVAAVALGYFFLLPMFAAAVAPRIPAAAVERLSTQALKSLDEHFLKDSALPAAQQDALRQRLAQLAKGRDLPAYQLYFRSSPMGPNAFALPGGELVVFDELVNLAENDAEVLGVLAHELGHVKYHHGLRQLIQSSVVSFAVSMYLGDLSSVLSGLGALVLESKYSRGFEQEADDYSARLMLAAGYGTAPLIAMFERLDKYYIKAGEGGSHLFSSHPETAARIARLRSFR